MNLSTEERIVVNALAGGNEWSRAMEAQGIVERLHDVGAHVCTGADCPDGSHVLPLPTEAHARSSDPDTSHLAALSISDLTDRQRAVYEVLAWRGPLTHHELCETYHGVRHHGGTGWTDLPPQEDQSIRSRCADLVKAGLVAPAGMGKSPTGRPSKRWAVIR